MPDEDRLTQLFRRYGPLIYTRCRRILGDDAAAEDAAQETFMRVHRHLEKAPPDALAWIYRIATNYCLNEVRDRRRRAEPRDDLPERVVHVEEALVRLDLAARLVERAAPTLRVTAWLHHVDGFEQEEVAQILGISRRAVVKRLFRFRADAQKFLRRTSP